VGFLDQVKGTASTAVESGKDLVHTQQLKLHLRKLLSEEDAALAAFGNAAYTHYEAGTLSMSSDLAAAAQRIKDARAAIEAKKSEIAAEQSHGNGQAPNGQAS
jgi:hypothetical protein